jgi:hypothetical protein
MHTRNFTRHRHEIGLYIVCFLLGNSLASEVYMPTFRNTLFHFHRHTNICRWRWNRKECFEKSAYTLQTPGNYPEENIKYSEQGKVRHQEGLYIFTINSTLSYTVIHKVLLLSSETKVDAISLVMNKSINIS